MVIYIRQILPDNIEKRLNISYCKTNYEIFIRFCFLIVVDLKYKFENNYNNLFTIVGCYFLLELRMPN